MKHQTIELIKSHFREILREPGIIIWGIIFPVFFSLGLGLAFQNRVTSQRNIILIEPATKAFGNELKTLIKIVSPQDSMNPLKKTYSFQINNPTLGISTYKINICSWDSAILMMKRGRTPLILEQKDEKLIYHLDPANAEAQLVYSQISNLIDHGDIQHFEEHDNISQLDLKGTRYIDFLIPGMIAMGVMMSCMWGIAYGMIERRRNKLLRRMIATPMKKSNYLLSVFLVRLTVNLVESTLLFLIVKLFFHIEIQGSWIALVLIYLSGNFAFMGLAALVSSRSSSTQVGNGLINLIVTPMMILSGIFFDYNNFPEWAISIIKVFPLTLFADSIRSIFNEGFGLIEVIVPLIVLSAIGFISFFAGLKIFKWY